MLGLAFLASTIRSEMPGELILDRKGGLCKDRVTHAVGAY